jgi:hypothetical protein
MDGACRRHRGDEKCIKILLGKLKGKRPLGRRSYIGG